MHGMIKSVVSERFPLLDPDGSDSYMRCLYSNNLHEAVTGTHEFIIGRHGIPTPLAPHFLGHFSPDLRRLFAVVLRCPASWRRDGENGRKMA